jgi:hypothetical protein
MINNNNNNISYEVMNPSNGGSWSKVEWNAIHKDKLLDMDMAAAYKRFAFELRDDFFNKVSTAFVEHIKTKVTYSDVDINSFILMSKEDNRVLANIWGLIPLTQTSTLQNLSLTIYCEHKHFPAILVPTEQKIENNDYTDIIKVNERRCQWAIKVCQTPYVVLLIGDISTHKIFFIEKDEEYQRSIIAFIDSQIK